MDKAEFMSTEEVAQFLGVSKSFAYKVIRKFNEKLEQKGYYTIAGRVNREYFYERTCYKGK